MLRVALPLLIMALISMKPKCDVFNINNHSFPISDDCSKIKMDLVFILDGSGSIGYISFLTMLDFVKNVTESFILGPNDVQIAVVSFRYYDKLSNHPSMRGTM